MHTKYFSFMITSFILIAFLQMLSCSREKSLEINSFQEIKEHFANPPAEFRSVPFWVWNDDMTEEEIEKQLTEMQEVGIWGVFIHPRPGLITPYLSDRWFELCRYTVDKAGDLGMEVWLYDENSYPSGFAGGHVPAEMPESYNQGQGLVLKRSKLIPSDSDTELYLVLKKEGAGYTDVSDRLDEEKTKSGDYYLFRKAYYRTSGWYGGYSYVDILVDGVTEKFLEITMDGYKKVIGDEFGKLVPGVFTDEPNIAPPVRRDCIRWTPALFSEFQKRWGYDLKINLPSLFDEIGDWKRIRHNYYSVLLDLFIEKWSKPYFQYCEDNNLDFTGHYWEHGWPSPHHGGDNMAMYAWHQVPAIDILMNEYAEDVNAQFGNVRAVKELRSVANQMGRTRTLSETYGAGGWDLRFEDMKRIADWQYVLGVNFTNQHLTYATLNGARKRDHPQSFSYHEPWWKFYKSQGDYLARSSLALSSGRQINRILVLEPTTSAWMYYSSTRSDQRLKEIGDSFQEFTVQLEKYQIEYDLGCENIIKDHGKVAAGKFIVGEGEYDVLVFPPGMDNLDIATANLIEEYVKSGGKVLSLIKSPEYIDGATSDIIKTLASQYSDQWTRVKSLADLPAREMLALDDFRAVDPELISGKLFHHRRQLDDGNLIYLVNTSMEEHSKGTILAKGKSISCLDLMTGEIGTYPANARGEFVEFSFDLPPVGSLLLYTGHSGSLPPEVMKTEPVEKVLNASSGLKAERIAPNMLTLDFCDLKLEDKIEKDIYFFQAADKIFKHHGFEGNPWSRAVQYKTNILDRDNFDNNSGFEADFVFQADAAADIASLQAVVERPGVWNVLVNGNPVEPRSGEWWLDRAFGIYDIGKYVVGGTNRLTISASPMTIHSELEPVYILGNFGLQAQAKGWKIVPSASLSLGEWKDQRMPFYSDGVAYTKTFSISSAGKKYVVKIGNWLGSVVEVRVNDNHAGLISSLPLELDITELVKDGENEISVVVYGTLKNLLGPHHNNPAHGRAWPVMFEASPDRQPPGRNYDVIGYGLFEDFSVIEEK